MPLTKGDKLIIIGAVVLALTVVAGLAAWRKPHLFPGKTPAPEMTRRDFRAQTPPPETSAAPQTAEPAAPSAPAPAPAPAPAIPAPPPPVTLPATDHVPAADSGPPAAGTPTAGPGDVLSPPQPVSPEVVAQHPLFAGDETLDKMFSEMGEEAAKAPQAAPKKTETPPKAAPEPVPASAEALDVPAGPAPPLATKKPVKDAPPAKAAPPSRSKGAVVAVSAADKPGEYVLTVSTTSPAGEVTRTYMDNPPRLVIDLAGRWTYSGPLSLSGKSPLVSLVRVGKHPDRLRLVLDLAPEATTRLREAPVVDRTPNGVTIRLPK